MSVMFADRVFWHVTQDLAAREGASDFSLLSLVWFFGVAFGGDSLRISHFLMLFAFYFPRSLWSVPAAFLDPGLLSGRCFSASASSVCPAPPESAPQLPSSCWRPRRRLHQQDFEGKFNQLTLKLQVPQPASGFEKKLKFYSSSKYIQNNRVFFGSSI